MGYLDYDGLETQVDCIKKYVKAEADLVREELRNRANIPIGFEYFSMNPNVPQGSLPLLGGEYSRATYSDLWAWVQEQTGYLKTEAEWQALSTTNNGNVPYYSDGDGSTTFRVPSLQCWVRGANGSVSTVGSYLAAGLPNIDGAYRVRVANGGYFAGITQTSGAFYTDGQYDATSITATYGTQTGFKSDFMFSASRSNAIYGNSTTVQPESIVGLWLVKAYGTIVDTGTIDEQQYIDDRIAALPNTFLPLAGGTMSGAIHFNGANNRSFGFDLTNNNTNMDIGWNWENRDGAGFGLRSTDDSSAGSFSIYARDGSDFTTLNGYPNGLLTWGGKEVERIESSGKFYIRYVSGLQICWGESLSVTTSGVVVNFPVPFNAPPKAAVSGGSCTVTYGWTNINATTITLRTNTSSGIIIYYIAIGYWK